MVDDRRQDVILDRLASRPTTAIERIEIADADDGPITVRLGRVGRRVAAAIHPRSDAAHDLDRAHAGFQSES